ncbi:GNAT family N-acetyltransferase [Kitasatospora cineracea]|uniref:CelD/BcsL family acetyltransferase involved in cellulose biosynthesis n=1 Tax=Kitasatospora cineracea TaxID=88074 RepID=A0A8G1UGF9_9ACTN|nr:GNAT family N-acetyltransferase [Kitasatospora cineracea]ROR37836.1 CelD/BcsL family acetyltransferase involved in cellulose biosynthesis [Kitasatospora cineracea]
MPEIHRTPELDGELVHDWRELVAQDPDGSWFAGPDWVLAWWRTLGVGQAGEIAVWRGPDGRAEAVLPLGAARLRVHRRVPVELPVLTLLGSGPGAADHCGPAVRPHRRAEVAAWLAGRARRETLWLPNLDAAHADLPPVGARPVARSACPRADLADGPDRLGSRDFRAANRRARRRLAAAGVDFHWLPPGSTEPALAAGLLDELLRLHRLRRAAAAGGASSFGADRLPLHRLLVQGAAPGRGPAFQLARCRGEVVGVLYGFRWADRFAYYQTGWDPRFAADSLGTALVDAALRDCAAEGVRTFDFLRGAEPYKYRFGAVDRTDTGWLRPRGPGGALLALKHRLAGGAPPAQREPQFS